MKQMLCYPGSYCAFMYTFGGVLGLLEGCGVYLLTEPPE